MHMCGTKATGTGWTCKLHRDVLQTFSHWGFSFSWLSVYFYFWWQAQSSQHKKGYQCSHISGKTFGSSSSSLLTAAAALSWRACDALHFSLKYPQRCSVGFRLGDILGHVIVLTFVLFWQCKLDHYHDCVVLFLKAVGDILTGYLHQCMNVRANE